MPAVMSSPPVAAAERHRRSRSRSSPPVPSSSSSNKPKEALSVSRGGGDGGGDGGGRSSSAPSTAMMSSAAAAARDDRRRGGPASRERGGGPLPAIRERDVCAAGRSSGQCRRSGGGQHSRGGRGGRRGDERPPQQQPQQRPRPQPQPQRREQRREEHRGAQTVAAAPATPAMVSATTPAKDKAETPVPRGWERENRDGQFCVRPQQRREAQQRAVQTLIAAPAPAVAAAAPASPATMSAKDEDEEKIQGEEETPVASGARESGVGAGGGGGKKGHINKKALPCPSPSKASKTKVSIMDENLRGMPHVPPCSSHRQQIPSAMTVSTLEDSLTSCGNTSHRSSSQSSVSFSTVEIREYPIALGDNPSVVSGPPLTIGWWDNDPSSTYRLDVDAYETKCKLTPPRKKHEMVLPQEDREILLANMGYSPDNIQKAMRDVNRAKVRRARTARTVHLEKMEMAFESLRRKAKRAVKGGKKPKDSDLYKEWVERREKVLKEMDDAESTEITEMMESSLETEAESPGVVDASVLKGPGNDGCPRNQKYVHEGAAQNQENGDHLVAPSGTQSLMQGQQISNAAQ